MRIIIIGSRGRLGSVLSSMFTSAGHIVVGIDISNAGILDQEIRGADIAILTVPIAESIGLLKKYAPACPIIETSSVKRPFKEFRNVVISIHPLFGPLSVDEEGMNNIAFIRDISPAGSIDIVRSLFPDFNIISMTAEDHDQLAIQLQVIPYIISILSSRLMTDTDVSTRSRNALAALARVSGAQNGEVLKDTIRLNPYSKSAFTRILEVLNEIGGEYIDSCPTQQAS